MCKYDLCIIQITCKKLLTCDLLKHFVRMFYLCFILTNKVINNVKVYFSHNKKNTTIDILSICGLFFFYSYSFFVLSWSSFSLYTL